jgi:hypothetical protein
LMQFGSRVPILALFAGNHEIAGSSLPAAL